MLRLTRILAIVAAACLAGGVLASNSGCVSASGKRFMLNGKPYFYGGCNCYYLMVYAADAGLRSHVDEVLE